MWCYAAENLPGIHRALHGFHPHNGGNESTKIYELSSTCVKLPLRPMTRLESTGCSSREGSLISITYESNSVS